MQRYFGWYQSVVHIIIWYSAGVHVVYKLTLTLNKIYSRNERSSSTSLYSEYVPIVYCKKIMSPIQNFCRKKIIILDFGNHDTYLSTGWHLLIDTGYFLWHLRRVDTSILGLFLSTIRCHYGMSYFGLGKVYWTFNLPTVFCLFETLKMFYLPKGRLLADSCRGPIVFTYVLFLG